MFGEKNMAIEKEKISDILGIRPVDTALEIMCDEGNKICSLAKEVKTVETDPKKAYVEYENVNGDNSRRHFVFCGNPVIFLKKMIAEKARVDLVEVNTDRLADPPAIWKLIGILAPPIVILGYRDKEKGAYHRDLMQSSGFKIIKQEVELNEDISEKFCVGRSNKFHSN